MLDEKFLLNQIVKNTEEITALKAELNAIRNRAYGDNMSSNSLLLDTQDALCETSIEVDERITAIEDALCELSEEE